MARLGVTYQDIANAANQLLGKGKQPTIELIRQFLGTGSSTTIANHLRQWRMEQDGTLTLASQENLPAELVTIMKGLWNKLCTEADARVRTATTEFSAAEAHLQEELKKYKNNNQRWQQLFNQWVQEKENLLSEKTGLEEAHKVLQQEKLQLQAVLATQIEQIQEKQERIQELHRLHINAQENLEHYREAMRTERAREQQQFDQQRQMWLAESLAFRDELKQYQEKNRLLAADCASLQSTREELAAKQAECQTQVLRANALETELEVALQSAKQWQHQCETIQGMQQQLTLQLIDSQAVVKTLQNQMANQQTKLEELTSQNKLLSHEKWMLAEERAQIAGQMQQMQKLITA